MTTKAFRKSLSAYVLALPLPRFTGRDGSGMRSTSLTSVTDKDSSATMDMPPQL